MKKNLLKINHTALALIFIALLAVIVPVSAIDMNIVLDKTYQFRLANISTIDAIDVGNLSLSRVEVQSTEGGGTDLQTIHTPVIRNVTRNFTTMAGTFNGITVTLTGDNPSTVDYTTKPDFKIYTKPMVPTIDISAPGHAGNPMVTKYNDSWVKGDTDSLSSLFRSTEGAYLYKTAGAAYANPATGHYLTAGTWDILESNLTYTLDRNKVDDLGSFAGDSTQSFNLGDFNPSALPTTGKYYAGAIYHDESVQTMSVYAMYPVVVINGKTPVRWTNNTGSFTAAPFTYISGSGSDLTLNFTGSNPDLGSITKIVYLFIYDPAQYDMDLQIDTQKLAENAETRWQTSFTPGTQVIDLLYDGIQNDVGGPYTYTMTAVGYPVDPATAPSTEWSTIAITQGFGISGRANADSITIPARNMSRLNPGLYDLYLMGTDAQNNVVALDQVQAVVTALPAGDKVGVFNSSAHRFYLRPVNYPITPVKGINWGASTDLPVTGDWNGDGITEVGVYRQSTHRFYLRPSDWPTNKTIEINWGASTDLPVTGDWNGDGTTEVGVYRQSLHTFYLRPSDWPTNKTLVMNWGAITDLPVTGNWSGDGRTEVGVYRPSTHKFYLRPSIWPNPTTVINWGASTDLPVTGDWNNDGTDEVGVHRQSAQKFYLRPSDWPTTPTQEIAWGAVPDLPVTGKWS